MLGPWVAHAQTNNAATGRPVILASVDEAGILYAHTLNIDDADGVPFSGTLDGYITYDGYSYQWIRVDGNSETNIGANSPRYSLVDADIGKQIKVTVSFTDDANNAESLTSLPFGPVTEPDPLPSPVALVRNTSQTHSATANITQQYAQEFTLGDHGQGYEISGVSIELAAAPSNLTVSLWIGKHPHQTSAPETKLFDFENPSSFAVGLNEFTAPAGALAYPNVRYYIVLSGFGSSLSIKETTSDKEDLGGAVGAELGDKAHVRALNETGRWGTSATRDSVLRLAVEGSRRGGGILFSTYAQPLGDTTHQEILSLGDTCCFTMAVGDADRYLIRGFSWNADDTPPRAGGFSNPFELHEGTSSLGDSTRRFTLFNTRNAAGIPAFTAPQGATVEGDKTYTFLLDFDLGTDENGDTIERLDATLTRAFAPAAEGTDSPAVAGIAVSEHGDAAFPAAPLMAIVGEPLYAMVQNLEQTDNGYVSLGGASAKVLSQAFRTGSEERRYQLKGIGVNIEGSNSRIPDGPTFVSVSLHADSNGRPGAKLFDLVSPTEYAPGHSFFEAPRGTTLEPSTTYVLVWRHNSGTWHRLVKTRAKARIRGREQASAWRTRSTGALAWTTCPRTRSAMRWRSRCTGRCPPTPPAGR